jgi:hypothetical protein
VVCSVVEVGERRVREEDEEVERKKKVHGQWGDASVRKKGRTCAENKCSFAFTLFGPTQASLPVVGLDSLPNQGCW